MRFDDFARPENLLRGAVKLFVLILGLLLLPTLLQILFRAMPGLAVLFGLAIASFIAYAIREGQRGGSGRAQQTGGAERTPVLPMGEEDF